MYREMCFVNKTDERIIAPTPVVVASPEKANTTVVCDGSIYDPTKPYLFVTLGNHIVKPLKGQTEELGFDATSGRMFSTVSLHDRCGAIVACAKHADALKDLGYPVVEWGQTIAFPMCAKAIKRMDVGKYLGAVAVHTFTEPMHCHNQTCGSTGNIIGDGTYDGCNHLAGAYIPVALALEAATKGDTLVNCETKHSGLELQNHIVKLIVGTNATSVCFQDKTGGSIAEDGKVIKCTNAVSDTLPLVVTSKQVTPGFDSLIQEMSGSKKSFASKVDSKIALDIGGGVFEKYDKRLEASIRAYASKKTELGAGNVSLAGKATPPKAIDVCDLSAVLQKSFVTTAMVAMKQPMCIGAPTVVISTADSAGKDTTKVAGLKEAAKYGDRFSTCSYTLETAHQMVPDKHIHKFFGIVAISHALFLSQMTSREAYDICAPFADTDSPFLDCTDPSCECNTKEAPPAEVVNTTSISSRFENMILGVSQNIAISSKMQTGRCKDPIPIGDTHPKNKPKPKKDIQCKAGTSFCGTCTCNECTRNAKLLHFAQLVASCTHAYQKCDNYVADQTMCAVNVNGIPQYKSTESMLPFGTAMKAIMMKSGPTEADPVKVRVGMNTDDCENCAFQSKAILDTLTCGSKCVSGDYFHGAKDNKTYNSASDDETIRCMRLGNLPKNDQRHILLAAHAVGKMVQANLSYFVTGSASKANDVKSTKTSTESGVHVKNNCMSQLNGPNPSVDLSAEAGNGLNAFGSKSMGQRVGRHLNTDSEAGAGLSGHCTCTLNIIRTDGMVHTTIVEGTAHVRMGPGDKASTVDHRGTLSSKVDDDAKIKGAGGYWKGPYNVDNAVDVSLKGLPSSHVATISNRLQVPGSNMRASMFMGTSEHVSENCETFYKNIVSLGAYQCVQTNGKGGVRPGADVKKYLNQKVLPVISSAIAIKGEAAVVEAMGEATCAVVQAIDTGTENYAVFTKNSARFRSAMSPLRLSIECQDRYMLNSMGSLNSLKVNFPDDEKLKAKYGNVYYTSHVTHVPHDDSTEGHAKICESIGNHALHMNSEYVNVRIASPVTIGSNEIVTLYRVYGMTDGL